MYRRELKKGNPPKNTNPPADNIEKKKRAEKDMKRKQNINSDLA